MMSQTISRHGLSRVNSETTFGTKGGTKGVPSVQTSGSIHMFAHMDVP